MSTKQIYLKKFSQSVSEYSDTRYGKSSKNKKKCQRMSLLKHEPVSLEYKKYPLLTQQA